MCTIWKSVGVVALSFSLIYNFFILFVIVTFVLRCYDDCDTDEPPKGGEYVEECYGAYALYTFYLPSVLAAPFIVLADFRNIYYLEWWLLFQAALTCCSCLNFICYNSFYSSNNIITNFLGVAFLIISFIFVANHLFKVRRKPAANITQNPAETNA